MTSAAFAQDLRREAADIETALRWRDVPPGLAPGVRARMETRMYTLREVADRLEGAQ